MGPSMYEKKNIQDEKEHRQAQLKSKMLLLMFRIPHENLFVNCHVKQVSQNRASIAFWSVRNGKPNTIDELREAIEEECAQIPREMLLEVCSSIFSRCEKCIEQNGNQFEHFMWADLFFEHSQIAPCILTFSLWTVRIFKCALFLSHESVFHVNINKLNKL